MMKKAISVLVSLCAVVLLSPVLVSAHGVNGHVKATDLAVDLLPDGELRDILIDPEVRSALQVGSFFPDSGYVVNNNYGEMAHWPPFVEAYVNYLRDEYGGDFDTLEKKKMLAFLLGAAAHGLEDDLFDSIFCFKSEQLDEAGQDLLDTGCDVFLVYDGIMDLQPDVYLPAADLETIFAERLSYDDFSASEVESGLATIRNGAIGGLAIMAPAMIEDYLPYLPWAYENYYNPDQPGSFPHESTVVAMYLQAIYARIRGEFTAADMLIETVPTDGARLLSVDHTSVDSWITLAFGAGVLADYINPDYVKLTDPDGNTVEAEILHSRYSGNDPSRLIRILPSVDLAYETEYTITLKSGIELIDGSTLSSDITYQFLSWCAPDNEQACQPQDEEDTELEPDATTETTKKSDSDDDGCATLPTHSSGVAMALLLIALLPLYVRKQKRKSDCR